MFVHIVMWKIAAENRQPAVRDIIAALEVLPQQIEQITTLRVGADISGSEFSSDVALYTEFASRQDYLIYKEHPAHLQAVKIVSALVGERRVVDFEL